MGAPRLSDDHYEAIVVGSGFGGAVAAWRADGETHVELWEHPRPSQQRNRSIERIAILGRVPAETKPHAPRIRTQISM